MKRIVALAGYLLLTLSVSVSVAAPQADEPYYDIGGYHQKVSTRSAEAQLWFDRGLAMCHAFNHEEAVRCFERALRADPAMAMAYWGMAYAWGPNINNTEIVPHQIAQAQLSVHLAKLQGETSSPFERDLISALSERYATPVPDDRQRLNEAYANAMRRVHATYPDEPLAVTLFAESLMVLRPWKHWTPEGEPAPETPEIVAVLEGALERWPNDAALCHLYIHALEASPAPARALPAADRLRNAMPGAGHLVHMPSHIDVLLGDYDRVIKTNQRAIAVDNVFLQREGAMNFYTLYRVHCYHFVVYGAMLAGQRELALSSSRRLVEQIPAELLQAQTDFLDAFIGTPMHAMVRFGEWEAILREPEPPAMLPMTRAVRHYARGLAYAATGHVEQAEAEQQAFARQSVLVPETSMLFNNRSLDILRVAEAMLAGEIAYRRAEYEQAFELLRESVRRDDSLNYDEPWGWMQPARHALGALLLEQGRVDEAEAVYRADLRRRPHNVWALRGLVESLTRQNKTDEAVGIAEQLSRAAQLADISIDRSCFCRTGAVSPGK